MAQQYYKDGGDMKQMWSCYVNYDYVEWYYARVNVTAIINVVWQKCVLGNVQCDIKFVNCYYTVCVLINIT